MSTFTATHAGPGHSLFAEILRFIAAMRGKPAARPKASADVSATAKIDATKHSTRDALWKLYRMSAGLHSVNPELFVEHIVQD